MTVLVELKNVTKRFGDRVALDNVTIQVQEGEILALLGPNGSGKSTLLKVLAFLLQPDDGEIKLHGEIINEKNYEKMRQQSSMVFQRTLLFSTNVYNNVAYGLKMRKIPKKVIEEEVSKTLSLVRLDGFGQRSARKLSGGEQQRVALARALVLKTKLLLLDEPTANLDPKNAAIVEEVIATANRELGTTIVIATHNMFQAEALPQRIALMNEGKITEVGTPAEVFSQLSKNLARFAAVDNTFTGTAKATSKGTTMVDIGNGVQVEVTAQRQGEVSIFVNPQDIILSKSSVKSSARNVFKGRINEITDSGSLVKLKVDVGKLFAIQVTKRSFVEMGLCLNDEVFIAFKASSVQVF